MEYKIVKKWISALLICLFVTLPMSANADVAGLVPCKSSKEFAKRLDGSVKKLEARLTKYKVGTPPALALEKQIEKTKEKICPIWRCRSTLWNRWITSLNYRWSLEPCRRICNSWYFLPLYCWLDWLGR